MRSINTICIRIRIMSEKFCLQWDDFQGNIKEVLGMFKGDLDFADVTLACEDGHQVEANKIILAASSPLFLSLLKRNKHSYPIIYMRGMKAEDLNNIALCNKGWHFWKGGFVTDKTGLKIFVFINAMIFAFTTFVTNPPLYGKIASKVWKIYFPYISPHFLDAAGSQISDLW